MNSHRSAAFRPCLRPQFCEPLRNINVAVRFRHAASQEEAGRNPARGCLFIETRGLGLLSFLFLSHTPITHVGNSKYFNGRAAEKQKRKIYWCVSSINRQPLAGFEDKLHSTSAYGDAGNDNAFRLQKHANWNPLFLTAARAHVFAA